MLEGKSVKWTNLEKESCAIEKVEKLPEGEYNAHLHLLSVEQEEYLSKVQALYHTNPTCELYNIINLVEQIGREFKKLK